MPYDTTPSPAFLRAVQNQKWTFSGALAELVDNSFGDAHGDAGRVEIVHDKGRGTLTIFDDGRGMEEIGALFKLGAAVGRSATDIAEYGSGGTMAILWLGKVVEVWTLRDGEVAYIKIEWAPIFGNDVFPIIDDDRYEATVANTPLPLLDAGHGTLVKVHLLHGRGRHVWESNVKRDLGSLYAPALRNGRDLMWKATERNGTEHDWLRLASPLPAWTGAHLGFDFTISVGEHDLPVRGAVGEIEGLSSTLTGVHIGFGHRVIMRTRDCFAAADGSERFRGNDVAGWLDLGAGWKPFLTTTKDEIRDPEIRAVLMGHVSERIRPLLQEREDEALRVQLNDLALELEKMLNARGRNAVNVTVSPDPQGERPVPSEEESTPNPNPGPPNAVRRDPDGDRTRRLPARTEIVVRPVSDSNIDGQLCSADYTSAGIDLQVNEGHPWMRQALAARPTQQQALHSITTAEIAKLLYRDPELRRRAFPRRDIEAIEARSEANQVGFIHRLLIDRIVEPEPEPA